MIFGQEGLQVHLFPEDLLRGWLSYDRNCPQQKKHRVRPGPTIHNMHQHDVLCSEMRKRLKHMANQAPMSCLVPITIRLLGGHPRSRSPTLG